MGVWGRDLWKISAPPSACLTMHVLLHKCVFTLQPSVSQNLALPLNCTKKVMSTDIRYLQRSSVAPGEGHCPCSPCTGVGCRARQGLNALCEAGTGLLPYQNGKAGGLSGRFWMRITSPFLPYFRRTQPRLPFPLNGVCKGSEPVGVTQNITIEK